MDLLASVAIPVRDAVALTAEAGSEGPGFQINLFWIITQALSFLLFLAILYFAALRRIGGVLEDRRQRIEQGLRDAEQARRDRERAEQEHAAALAAARREANEIIARAQRASEEARAADVAATREELDRMRERAQQEIVAEKNRAIADLRTEVADLALAAAGKIVGESMTDARQRELVQEFLRESAASGSERNG